MNRYPLLPQIWLPPYVGSEKSKLPSIVIRDLEKLVQKCACSVDGRGFGATTGAVPYLETTKFAVAILSFLAWCGDTKPIAKIRDGCIGYLLSLHKQGSGFADHENGEPLVFATYYALVTLMMLDALEPGVANGCRDFLASNAEPDGLPKFANFPTDISHCFWGVVAASVFCDPSTIYGKAPIDFLARCRNSDGTYSISPMARGGGQVQPTVEAMIVRHQLKNSIRQEELEKSRKFLINCRMGADEFGEGPGIKGSPRDWMLGAIGLYALAGEAPSDAAKPMIITEGLWKAFSTVISHLAMYSGVGVVEHEIKAL